MVKHIFLTSLFLFMPLTANCEGVVLGHDLDERNIPLEISIMDRTFNLSFSEYSDYDNIRDKFYMRLYHDIDVPFSARELYKICSLSVVTLGNVTRSGQCAEFVKYYIQGIVNRQIDYDGKKMDIGDEARQEVWNRIKSFSVDK